MSKLVINEPDPKSGFQDGELSDAYLMYVCLQKPNKDQEGNQKYELKAVVDEDTADAFEAKFKQNKVYKIATEEFENVFKVAAPFPEQKKQFYVRFSMPYLDGDEPVAYDAFKRPKAYVPTEQAGVVEDITKTKLIGNGSLGTINFYITEHKGKYFPKMRGVLVNELIEFEARSGNSGSPFGVVKGADSPFGATEAGAEKQDAPPLIEETPKF